MSIIVRIYFVHLGSSLSYNLRTITIESSLSCLKLVNIVKLLKLGEKFPEITPIYKGEFSIPILTNSVLIKCEDSVWSFDTQSPFRTVDRINFSSMFST